MPELVYEFSYHADLEAPTFVGQGPGPYGQRLIFGGRGGTFDGDRLKGTLVPGTVDWFLLGTDGFGRLDARVTFLTHDGAVLYASYFGLLQVTPGIMDVLGGGQTPTEYEDHYFRTQPRFETGDERYAWINQTYFVAEGRLVPGPAVDYRVYRVT
jgi:hypothetical protein